MIEEYKLVLTHYLVDKTTGERIKLDEPLCIEHVFDRTHCGSPILLNRMFDEMKAYALARAEGKITTLGEAIESLNEKIKEVLHGENHNGRN